MQRRSLWIAGGATLLVLALGGIRGPKNGRPPAGRLPSGGPAPGADRGGHGAGHGPRAGCRWAAPLPGWCCSGTCARATGCAPAMCWPCCAPTTCEAQVRQARAALTELQQSTRPQAQRAAQQTQQQWQQARRELERRRLLASQQAISHEALEQAIEAETLARLAAEQAQLQARALQPRARPRKPAPRPGWPVPRRSWTRPLSAPRWPAPCSPAMPTGRPGVSRARFCSRWPAMAPPRCWWRWMKKPGGAGPGAMGQVHCRCVSAPAFCGPTGLYCAQHRPPARHGRGAPCGGRCARFFAPGHDGFGHDPNRCAGLWPSSCPTMPWPIWTASAPTFGGGGARPCLCAASCSWACAAWVQTQVTAGL